jgi:hypothetical protein
MTRIRTLSEFPTLISADTGSTLPPRDSSARDFSSADIDPTLLMSIAGAVASANDRLRDNTAENRVWIHSRSKRLTHR